MLQQSHCKTNCIATTTTKNHTDIAKERRERERMNGEGGNLVWIPNCELALAIKQNFGVWQISLAIPLSPYSSFFFFFFAKLPAPAVGRVSLPEMFPRAAKLVLTGTGDYPGFPVGPVGWVVGALLRAALSQSSRVPHCFLHRSTLHSIPVSQRDPLE